MPKGIEGGSSRSINWEEWVIRKIGLSVFGIEEEKWESVDECAKKVSAVLSAEKSTRE